MEIQGIRGFATRGHNRNGIMIADNKLSKLLGEERKESIRDAQGKN